MEDLRLNLIVAMAMRVAYMDDMGLIDIPEGVSGENEIALFVNKTVAKYISKLECEPFFDVLFDEFIEKAILEKYGARKDKSSTEEKPSTDEENEFEKLGKDVESMIDELKRCAHIDIGVVDARIYAIYKALQYLEEQVVNLNKRIK